MATEATAPGTSAAAHVDYGDWRNRLDYRQGEHFTLIGPNGSGKTLLATREVLPRRRYVMAFITKRRDPTLDQFMYQGYDRFQEFRDVPAEVSPRRVIAPQLQRGLSSRREQADVFRRALEAAFRQGGWTVYLDECRYVTDFLGLSDDVELLLHQGRSLGVSVVSCGQRPFHLPQLAYDQARHLVFFQENDQRNLKRVGELGGLDRDLIAAEVPALAEHELLYVNTREKRVERTLPPPP